MKKFIRWVAIVLILAMSISLTGVITLNPNVKAATSKKISISKKKMDIRVGKTKTLKLKNAKAKNVKWYSSKPKVAKVSKKGVVTALKKGKTTITAKYKNKKYKCKVTVQKVKKDMTGNKTEGLDDKSQIKVGKTLVQAEYLVDELYDNENIIVSPASLNMALGMVANGATDKVKADLEEYLGTTVEEYNMYSLELLNRAEKDEMLSIANGVWYDQNKTINEAFNTAILNNFKATIKSSPLDESTVEEINQWASDNTDGMIKKVINEISNETVAILANALLFDGEWTKPFEGNDTYKEDFKKFDGEKIKVDMMHNEESIYYENDYAIGFEKTYGKEKEYSFIAILPKNEGEFKLSKLDLDTFLASKTGEYKVNISMPKFNYDWNSSLNNVLEKTNLKSIYDKNINPLGNMLVTGIEETVYVSDISQSCKIIVDEKGTKAAAVTTIIVECTSAIIDPTPTKTVKLNRPFGYIIMDNVTNEVLFMGKVVVPTQE